MGLSREILERQLARVKNAQQTYEQGLESKDPGVLKKDAKWRKLNADRRAVINRMNALETVEERDAALVAKKSETAEA